LLRLVLWRLVLRGLVLRSGGRSGGALPGPGHETL
jgi:hypothetical protein